MSSFIYPNSYERKMYGQAGRALQRQNKRFNEFHRASLAKKEHEKQKQIDALRESVKKYEALPWWKKLWYSVLELFGKRKTILE